MACSKCNKSNCTCGVPLTNCCDVGPRGKKGLTGAQGPPGPDGAPGQGVPPAGDPGQVLAKIDFADYNTHWITIADIGAVWGNITGLLSDQLDLQAALNAKQNTITLGTNLQYFRGDLSLATFPTLVSSFTNDAGYITNANGLFVNNATDATLTRSGAGPYTLGLNLSNANTWLSDVSVPDEVFGPGWNGSVEVPTKNAVYDAISAIISGVASVTAADSTLTIAPTTGAVIAGLNLSNANTWLADQSVPDEAFGIGWDNSLEVPTKNAIYDEIISLIANEIDINARRLINLGY
jgi:hypothetical protein